MKESISYTYLLNIMLIFIVISFCVFCVAMSYSKAYRVNSKIANALEVAEGYNELSKIEIQRVIDGMGYQTLKMNCKARNFSKTIKDASGNTTSTTVTVEPFPGTKGYCLYEIDEEDYYYYGITTYMLFDFSVIRAIKIPVHNNSEKIYKFS